MIRIQQLKLPVSHTEEQLKSKIAKTLRLPINEIKQYNIRKQSVDARKKQEVSFVYTVDVEVPDEQKLMKNNKNNHVSVAKDVAYLFPESGTKQLKHRPVIIGSGPAGLFCGYLLAQHGYRPLILERGRCVEERQKDVARFWENNILDIHSNVQFGEGGAGTFSDGKLNTLVKDVKGRNKKVLDIFISHGRRKKLLM